MEIQKENQLKKVKRLKKNRLSRSENEMLQDFIFEKSEGHCQVCHGLGEECHHSVFGQYGANKDDRSQLLVCRECHSLCHKSKYGEVNTRAVDISVENWEEFKGTL